MPGTWRDYQYKVLKNIPKKERRETRRRLRRALKFVTSVFDDQWLARQYHLLRAKRIPHALTWQVSNTGSTSISHFVRLGTQLEIMDKIGKLPSIIPRLLDQDIASFAALQAELYWIQILYEAGHAEMEIEAPLPTGQQSDILVEVDSRPLYVEIKTIVNSKRIIRDAQLQDHGERILGEIKHHCQVVARFNHKPSVGDFDTLRNSVTEVNRQGLPYAIHGDGLNMKVDPLFDGDPETMTVLFKWSDEKIAETVLRQFRAAQEKFPNDLEGPAVVIMNLATSSFDVLDERLERDLIECMQPQISAVILMEPRHPLGMGDVSEPLRNVLIPNEKAKFSPPPIPTTRRRFELTAEDIEWLSGLPSLLIRVNVRVNRMGRVDFAP